MSSVPPFTSNVAVVPFTTFVPSENPRRQRNVPSLMTSRESCAERSVRSCPTRTLHASTYPPFNVKDETSGECACVASMPCPRPITSGSFIAESEPLFITSAASFSPPLSDTVDVPTFTCPAITVTCGLSVPVPIVSVPAPTLSEPWWLLTQTLLALNIPRCSWTSVFVIAV